MNENVKKEYLDMIDDLDSDLEILQIVRDFVEKHEGPESDELHKMLIATIRLSIDIDLLESKAESYDDLAAMKKEQDEQVNEVLEELEKNAPIDLDDIIVPVSDSEEKKQ